MSAMAATIKLHRLSGQEILLEVEKIEAVEAIPNTVIVLSSGDRFFVRETAEEVTSLVHKQRGGQGSQEKPHSAGKS